MFGFDGIMAAFFTFFQDFFMNEIFSFITGLIGGVFPPAG
jgi:hypothetical protein